MTTYPIARRSNNHFVPRPAEGVWPGLATPPHSALRARIAEALFRRAVHTLPVRVVFAGGERIGRGGPGSPVMRIVRPAAFFHRLGCNSKIGFGESYMVGDWTSSDLADLLTPFAARLSVLIPPLLQRIGRRFAEARQPREERNTVAGSRENIHRHYDLSNELFATFLDETMSYSSGWFAHPEETLADAQRRKIDGILDMAQVGPDTHVLEIGTGWGGLATRAAQRGARVTTLTISAEQARLAEERLAAAGVADRVQVLLRDYREARGSYDAVVSVEMIEAVGANHWDEYFMTVDRLLVPGGRFGLQAILQDDATMLATAETYTWIRKYIFPGGQIASVPAIERTLTAHTCLRITDRYSFGRHYAETLRRWRARFEEQAQLVDSLGFDETFRRMWSLYLAYSEAGFRTGYLDVAQLTLTKP